MITLNNLTTEELQYVRSKWASEITELDKEKARKQERLEAKLESQGDDAAIKAGLEADITHAEAVRDLLVASNADAAIIASQNAVIAELQSELNGIGLSSSYVSPTDAILQQMDLDELAYASQRRAARIVEIDAI
tara:strand:- start:3223 stop:3627 length:405 start_codon:yes stop_codon:yes gene_type:complete